MGGLRAGALLRYVLLRNCNHQPGLFGHPSSCARRASSRCTNNKRSAQLSAVRRNEPVITDTSPAFSYAGALAFILPSASAAIVMLTLPTHYRLNGDPDFDYQQVLT